MSKTFSNIVLQDKRKDSISLRLKKKGLVTLSPNTIKSVTSPIPRDLFPPTYIESDDTFVTKFGRYLMDFSTGTYELLFSFTSIKHNPIILSNGWTIGNRGRDLRDAEGSIIRTSTISSSRAFRASWESLAISTDTNNSSSTVFLHDLERRTLLASSSHSFTSTRVTDVNSRGQAAGVVLGGTLAVLSRDGTQKLINIGIGSIRQLIFSGDPSILYLLHTSGSTEFRITKMNIDTSTVLYNTVLTGSLNSANLENSQMARGRDGSLYVCTEDGILKINDTGSLFEITAKIGEGINFRKVEIDTHNRIWARNHALSDQVKMYTSDGDFLFNVDMPDGDDYSVFPGQPYVNTLAEFGQFTPLSGHPDRVKFLDSSNTVYTTSTSASVTLPSSIEEGDFLVMHIMHRDTLSLPSGWTLLDGPTAGTIFTNQRQSLAYKVAEASDAGASVTCTQASSQRIALHVQAFYSNQGIVKIASEAVEQEAAGLTLPELTATRSNQMAVVSMTNVYANTSGSTFITPPEGYIQTTPTAVSQNRLGCGYKTLDNLETISGRFNTNSDDTDRTAISLILDIE